MLNVSTFAPHPHPVIDTRRANSARVWNYWLGGKDHYPLDHEVGEKIRAHTPGIVDIARACRGLLLRAVRHLASDAGSASSWTSAPVYPPSTPTTSPRPSPRCRIVYVDHDPLVLAHALLTSTPQGSIDYLDAELREPEKILQHTARTLDFTQPVALILLETVHHLTDDDAAHAIVTRLLDAPPTGSYLLLSHPTANLHRAAMLTYTRSPPAAPSTRFFDALELLEPGVVSCSLWRPDPIKIGAPGAVDAFGGVGRKRDVLRHPRHTAEA